MSPLVSVWGQDDNICLSQSPSNHGATGARAGPHAMQVKGQFLSVTNIHNSLWRPVLDEHH